MPGFRIANRRSAAPLRDLTTAHRVSGELAGGLVRRLTIDKFMDDKAFAETAGHIVVLEGYLLNKRALLRRYGAADGAELVIRMLEQEGETFFSAFRGGFSGAVYVKAEGKWIVFTDQVGDAPVFYLHQNGLFGAGSQVNYLIDLCRDQGVELTFDEDCARQLLTYGFAVTDDTLAQEIWRLRGGDYLVFQDGQLSVRTYHRFTHHPDRFQGCSEGELVEAVDRAFRAAVALDWAKDEEYGYEHLADLSGGLDSRMGLWVAHDIQDRHATVLTYSKKGYLDETVARDVAAWWGDEFLFRPLDDGAFLRDVEENTFLLGGLSLYSGITGGKRFLASLDMDRFGLEHTGMVGDAVLGSFYQRPDDEVRRRPSGMYSEKLKDRLPEAIRSLPDRYDDYELFLMYARGFHGACNTHLLRRHFTETASPFLNTEFLQLCCDLPLIERLGHRLYKRWVLEKYPAAARFPWEKTGGRIGESPLRTKLRRLVKKGPRKLLRLLGRADLVGEGMNPIDYWLARNRGLQAALDEYEAAAMKTWSPLYSEGLRDDMAALYGEGNADERAMVLTVLAATKLYFGETLPCKS